MIIIKEGDILLAEWGYEANNPNFFKVIKRTEHQATLMELTNIIVERSNHYLGGTYVIPSDEPKTWSVWWDNNYDKNGDKNTKPVIIKKKIWKSADQEFIKLAYYAWAKPWNGQPSHDYCYH